VLLSPANKTRLGTFLFLIPGLLSFFGLFFYPVLITIKTSFSPDRGSPGFTLNNYVDFLTNREGVYAIGFTVFIAISATLLAILLTLPVIMLLREKIFGNQFFRLVILTPLMIPGVISALGLFLFWDKWGWVNLFLVSIVPFIKAPLRISFTIYGLILFYAWLFFPYTCLTSLSAIESIDRNIEEASFVCGANRWQTFRLVLLPLTMRGIVAGSILTFILCFGALSIPLILGGNYRPYLMTARIYTYATVFRKWGAACAMAVIMGIVQILFISVYLKFSAKRSTS
jgi:ABC-type spermidine/putrescine transport system permease subunit I